MGPVFNFGGDDPSKRFIEEILAHGRYLNCRTLLRITTVLCKRYGDLLLCKRKLMASDENNR